MRLYSAFETRDSVVLELELMSRCDLFDELSTTGVLREGKTAAIVHQVLTYLLPACLPACLLLPPCRSLARHLWHVTPHHVTRHDTTRHRWCGPWPSARSTTLRIGT